MKESLLRVFPTRCLEVETKRKKENRKKDKNTDKETQEMGRCQLRPNQRGWKSRWSQTGPTPSCRRSLSMYCVLTQGRLAERAAGACDLLSFLQEGAFSRELPPGEVEGPGLRRGTWRCSRGCSGVTRGNGFTDHPWLH